MILEHALLPVHPGEEANFEASFEQARPLISSQAGFRSLSLSRSIESPSHYLLLVEWDNIEAHTDGFRGSSEYQDWKQHALTMAGVRAGLVVFDCDGVLVNTSRTHTPSSAPDRRTRLASQRR